MVTFKPLAFSSKDYAFRRHELIALLKEDSIVILPGAVSRIRNSDVHYRFRQNSDFLYLTGFEESDAVLALVPGREHGQTILFCQERDDIRELWHGDIRGPEAAIECLGVDDAFPIADIDEILPGLIEGRSSLYYPMGHDVGFDNQIIDWVNMISANGQKYRTPSVEFIQLDQFLHELRLHKSDAELKLMRQAARATCQGHLRILRFIRPGMMEFQIEAELYHEFAMHGAREPAYPAIVGGGSNACVLHYIANNDELRDGDLVLVDAGGEFENYACDLTRTFPVNGRFSPAQSQIYDIVINAQLAAIDAVKPGNTWNEPHEAAVREITAGLLGLGILIGDLEELIETAAYLPYYPHKTGHWLGLDVHDVGDYQVNGMWRVFEEGMVTAIEPGIYFDPSDQDLPEHYRGIGIRIEDDVLVTRTGNEVLTGEVPKTIKDIESFMAGHRS
jgi:Xaa-Pro aminopeptidase